VFSKIVWDSVQRMSFKSKAVDELLPSVICATCFLIGKRYDGITQESQTCVCQRPLSFRDLQGGNIA
jgi:hypothetical protein